MKFREYLALSHREFTTYRTRSIATIIAVGILFGLVLGIITIAQGLEDTILRYAGDATNGKVYLASAYEGGERNDLILERIAAYNGELVSFTDEIAEATTNLSFRPQFVAIFDRLSDAYNYSSMKDYVERHYNYKIYYTAELFSNQVAVYSYFRQKDAKLIVPISAILLITAAFILAFTMAHILSQNTKTFLLYRSLGAARSQILLVYFFYLLELCFYAMIFAILLALIIAGIFTGWAWQFLSSQMAELYPNSPFFPPILIGINFKSILTILLIFAAAPFSFLLCIDQFSARRIALKLKGD